MQLFLWLEADDLHSISPDYFSLAVLSWAELGQVAFAHAAWQRHTKLTTQLTAVQQQQVFASALGVLTQQPDAAAMSLVNDVCMLGAQLGLQQSPGQMQQLVDVLLTVPDRQQAHTVSRCSC